MRDPNAIDELDLGDNKQLSLHKSVLHAEGICGLPATSRSSCTTTAITRLSDDDYDALLTRNIVFLKLVDCSAVNTVIECIERNTVIIVNRHPALEEVSKGEEGHSNLIKT